MRFRSLRITAGLAAVLLVTLGAVACGSTSQPADQPAKPMDTSGSLGAASWAAPFATAAIATESGPEFMIVVDGAVWVSAHRGGALQRIDPATNAITDTVPIGGELEQPVFMFGSIWVISTADHQLIRVDPTTGQVTGSVPCGCHGAALAKYGDLVATSIESFVVFYDPVTTKQVRRGEVYGDDHETIYGFAFAGDDTWMISQHGTKVYRVSLTTLTVTLVLPMSVLTIAYVGGRLLTVDTVGRLQQIDPANGAAMATWQLAKPDKYDFTSGVDVFDDGTGNGVWVNPVSTALTHVDLVTGQTRQITGMQFEPEVNQNVLVADGTMWVSDWRYNVVLRMKP
jgi:streptogramin lyase